MTRGKLYDVTRTNGREVEVVRRLDLYTARRIVERDNSNGGSAYMLPTPASVTGRIVR